MSLYVVLGKLVFFTHFFTLTLLSSFVMVRSGYAREAEDGVGGHDWCLWRWTKVIGERRWGNLCQLVIHGLFVLIGRH